MANIDQDEAHLTIVKMISDMSDRYEIGVPTIMNFVLQDVMAQMGAIDQKSTIKMFRTILELMEGKISQEEMRRKSKKAFWKFVKAFEEGMDDEVSQVKAHLLGDQDTREKILDALKRGDRDAATKFLKDAVKDLGFDVESISVHDLDDEDERPKRLH